MNNSTTKPHKILFIRPVLNRYGATKSIINIAKGLSMMGHEVIFLSANTTNQMQDLLEKDGFKYYWAPLNPNNKSIFSYLSSFLRIIYICKVESIDLIHSHHRWSSFISLIPKVLLNIPLITTCHNIHTDKRRYSYWGDGIICVSHNTKGHLIEHYHIDERKTIVIENCINLPNKVNHTNQHVLSLKDDVRYIANIARLSPEKNQKMLLTAFSLTLKIYSDVALLMVGGGILMDELISLTKDLGIIDNVHFLNEINNVFTIYQLIEFSVISSYTEGLPMTLLESFVYGKPVISTNVGGISEVLIHNNNGLLVPNNDPDSMSAAILRLLEDPSLTSNLGINAYKLASSEYSIESISKRTFSYYNSIKLS